MAMHLGRAVSRSLSRFAVAPPAARHLSTRALNQAPQRPFFPRSMIAAARTIWIFGAACILDYESGWDVTGRWKKIQDQRDLEREEFNERLERMKSLRKDLEALVNKEEQERRGLSNQ